MFVVTVPVTARILLRGQLAHLRDCGFEITVISSPGPDLDLVAEREGVRVVGIPMSREIDPLRDLVALERLTRVLRTLRPDIVNASTAKAGLLGMIGAATARVPIRVYMLRGLRLETERGLKRSVLGLTERAAVACSNRIVCVSESLRQQYIAAGFARPDTCSVLGTGSSNGVEIDRFARTPSRVEQSAALRRELGISPDSPVIGFIGRPVADKGISELLDAFTLVIDAVPRARLVLVGAGFADDTVEPSIADRLRSRSEVILIGHVAEPAPYYAMMDVLAFPSHREGLPNAPLEAAAASVPTVGFRATGVTDVVQDGATGLLFDIGDTRGLASGLARYLLDHELRRTHGIAARRRAAEHFAREIVWARWRDEYERLLAARGLPLPVRQRAVERMI